MVSLSGVYEMGSLFCPGLLSHSCGLSPLGTDLEVIILLSATLRGVLMKRALKMLFDAPFTGVWSDFLLNLLHSVHTWECRSFR